MSSMPPPPPPSNHYQANQPMSPADEKLWATLVHIGGIFFNFLPALIGYLVLRDRGPFVRQHTATALNFQLTIIIGYVAGVILSVVLIGILVLIAVAVLNLVFSIMAAIAANKGEGYVYPIAIKFVN